MALRILIILTAIVFGFQGHPQTNWDLKKDGHGIKVWAADSGATSFKAVKVECLLKGNINRLIEILLDVDNHKNWVYSTIHSYLVKKISEKELRYYVELEFPLFTKNRDLVIDMVINRDTTRNVATIYTDAVTGVVPEKDGIIRIVSFHARYEVDQVDQDHLHIVYYSVADPGGAIWPARANLVVAKGPYNTFINLSGLLAK